MSKIEFSPIHISTITVTTKIPNQIHIIDIAKWLPLDSEVIGIRLSYAGNSQRITRGVAKPSENDFHNQTTLTIRIPPDYKQLVSCKIFHNGRIHVTGSHTVAEAAAAVNTLLQKLSQFSGCKKIALQDYDKEHDFQKDAMKSLLISHDNLIYNSRGNPVGWIADKKEKKRCVPHIYIHGEYVTVEKFDGTDFPVFVSKKWTNDSITDTRNRSKTIYDLDGIVVGQKKIKLEYEISKRHFTVKFGYVYIAGQIVGKETLFMNKDHIKQIKAVETYKEPFLKKGYIIHCFEPLKAATVINDDFELHMTNVSFKADLNINMRKLHQLFLDSGYYSRYEPCNNSGCNLRFRYNSSNADTEFLGICPCESIRCTCKKISVSLYSTGKISVVGLPSYEHGEIVYEFIKKFLDKHRKVIENVVYQNN